LVETNAKPNRHYILFGDIVRLYMLTDSMGAWSSLASYRLVSDSGQLIAIADVRALRRYPE